MAKRKGKSTFQHVLPPVVGRRGRIPTEFTLMPKAAALAKELRAGGEPDELLSAGTIGRILRCDPLVLKKEGRGPEATAVGGFVLFRRRAVIAWLEWLAGINTQLETGSLESA
jgi:hypothetical protein